MEKVSIVCPAYNQGIYLKEAIDSILLQDYHDWKLYIIDDGSTDNTKEIALEYVTKYPVKIEYYYKENGGTGSALNFGYALAKGQYHTYISSDNIYFHDFISGLLNVLETKLNVGFVYSDFQFIDEKGNIGEIIRRPAYVKNMFLNGCYIGLCFMWRRKLYEQIGGFDIKYNAQDYDFSLKCEELTDIYHTPFILGYYRDHSKTVSNVKGYDDTKDVVNNAKKRRGLL